MKTLLRVLEWMIWLNLGLTGIAIVGALTDGLAGREDYVNPIFVWLDGGLGWLFALVLFRAVHRVSFREK